MSRFSVGILYGGESEMTKFGLLSTSAISSAALFGMSMVFATPAFAQNADGTPCTQAQRDAGTCTDQPAATQPAANANIVVTGSRIRRPNLESNVPITSVSADDLTAQGDVNVGDALNDLPSLRSTFSQANSTRFIGTTGLNLLDLRGLGQQRTLVLVNGRRHITASPGDFLVDVNTIPTDLIERVDVITGGSSAVYGSDAVAGVVNFVLRRDFDGIRLRGQGGVSQQGDRGIEFVSLTAGRNFADDRANIAINLEYVNANPLYFTQRPALTGAYDGRCQFDIPFFTTGEPATGNGVPDRVFLCGVRNATISNGGTVVANASAAQCQSAAFGPGGASAAIGSGALPVPRHGAGRAPHLPLRRQRQPAAGHSGGRPQALWLGQLHRQSAEPRVRLDAARHTGLIFPGLDRYTANLLFHFDISDAFRPFAEAKYVHIFSRQEGQPSFFSPLSGTIGLPNFSCGNPYLTPANITQLQAIGFCTAPPAGTIPMNRFNVDFGGRSELVTRNTYRAVFGVQGDFNDDWNYEVSATWGHVHIHQDELNDLIITDAQGNLDGFSLAYDAVRNAQGQIVCRVNQVTVTRPDCVPINLFGNGLPTQAALDFVNTTSYIDASATEWDAVAYINGDLSQLFEFPGGPARFVLGAEYRRETAFLQADPLSTADNPAGGGTFFNAFALFDPQAFVVKEAFGELELPLLRDLPFAQELTITGAARYSDYNTSANHTFAYNINGTWAPVRDIRFRANYSQSVRVPTLSDLFTPRPARTSRSSPTRATSRISADRRRPPAQLRFAGHSGGLHQHPGADPIDRLLLLGQPEPDRRDLESLTIGTVITPRWLPGFSLTIDYYRIRVHNLIAVLGAQTILNQCYDLAVVPEQPVLPAAEPAQCGLHLRQSGADFGGRQLRPAESGRRRFRGELPAHLRQRSSPRLPRHPDLRHPPRQLHQPDRSDLPGPAAFRVGRSADHRQRRRHLRLRSVRYALLAQLYRPPDDRRVRAIFPHPGQPGLADQRGLHDRALLSGRALPQRPPQLSGQRAVRILRRCRQYLRHGAPVRRVRHRRRRPVRSDRPLLLRGRPGRLLKSADFETMRGRLRAAPFFAQARSAGRSAFGFRGLGKREQRHRGVHQRPADIIVAKAAERPIAQLAVGHHRTEQEFVAGPALAQDALGLEPGQHRADRRIAQRLHQIGPRLVRAEHPMAVEDRRHLALARRQPQQRPDARAGVRIALPPFGPARIQSDDWCRRQPTIGPRGFGERRVEHAFASEILVRKVLT